MRITILANGSQGNASLIQTRHSAMLIDIGLSMKEMSKRLALCQIMPEDIAGIFITHEHHDHIRGLKQWSQKYRTPILCNRNTQKVLEEKIGKEHRWISVDTNSPFDFLQMTVSSFSIPHDAVDPVGLVVTYENRSFCFLTDLGYVSKDISLIIKKVNGLLLEMNYDEDLLKIDTKRPLNIKERIRSNNGHLSNSQAAEAIKNIYSPNLKYLFLGHMSRDCNREDLALSILNGSINPQYTRCYCTYQDKISETVDMNHDNQLFIEFY